jgi:hypothetical protein
VQKTETRRQVRWCVRRLDRMVPGGGARDLRLACTRWVEGDAPEGAALMADDVMARGLAYRASDLLDKGDSP